VRRALAACAAALLFGLGAASDPSERLPDPAAEARARELFAEIRCVVCQNESIDDSDAELAGDLRRIVREQVAAGRTDGQVRGFLTERYGEFVLLRPTFSPANLALWATPFLIVLAGLAIQLRRRRRPPTEAAALTPEEERRLREIVTRSDAARP
jgi:cytochrome c-type biogenesis protein CcmH